jgi:molybdopterin-binding protein
MQLSARNQIAARVTGITRGEATANVQLDANGIRLVASITVEAADELGLSEGQQVVAIVKASDVMIGVGTT